MEENALTFAETGKDFLEHYGIKGMKWGVRRSPEELGHRTSTKKKTSSLKQKVKKLKKKVKADNEKRKAAAEKKKREEILKDPVKLYKNRYKFSEDEIKDALKWFDTEKKLRDFSSNKIASGRDLVSDFSKTLASGISGWNSIAKIHNSIAKEADPWVIIGNAEQKKPNNKKNEKK